MKGYISQSWHVILVIVLMTTEFIIYLSIFHLFQEATSFLILGQETSLLSLFVILPLFIGYRIYNTFNPRTITGKKRSFLTPIGLNSLHYLRTNRYQLTLSKECPKLYFHKK